MTEVAVGTRGEEALHGQVGKACVDTYCLSTFFAYMGFRQSKQPCALTTMSVCLSHGDAVKDSIMFRRSPNLPKPLILTVVISDSDICGDVPLSICHYIGHSSGYVVLHVLFRGVAVGPLFKSCSPLRCAAIVKHSKAGRYVGFFGLAELLFLCFHFRNFHFSAFMKVTIVSNTSGEMVSSMVSYSSIIPVFAVCMRWLRSGITLTSTLPLSFFSASAFIGNT